MKGNSTEEDIILLKDFTEGNFKTDKLENYKGSYKMGYFNYKDIQQAIEHILSDYKRVLKENEELKFKERSRIIGKYGDAEIHDVINRTLSNDYIPVQKVKDKIRENEEKNQKLKKKKLYYGV